MTHGRWIAAASMVTSWVAVGACGSNTATTSTTHNHVVVPPPAPAPTTVPERIASDVEAAVKRGPEAFVDLFDFEAVGEYEILLHRYDLAGRHHLSAAETATITAEDGTPYPALRERRNVGNFYPRWVSAAVGTGGCANAVPRTHYGQRLATIDDLAPGTPPGYQILHDHAAAWVAAGGVVGVRCTGGAGGVAVVWTKAANARGYNLITIYND